MQNPYDPVDQSNVTIDGLDIGAVVGTIRKQGYAVVVNFITPQKISTIRSAFLCDVAQTEMRAHGTETRRTRR
ncbi:MAG: hypothetical protein VYA08_12740, partial [Pseudomonadota bacterium]|nr:hypothetical protein [Pseudomonadota bacterium]